MKKLVVGLVLLLISCNAYALDLSKIALKQGIAYSLDDHGINYLSTTDLINYGAFHIEAGIAGDAEHTNWKPVGVLSVDLIDFKGVSFPIIDQIKFRPGVWLGWGNINFSDLQESEFTYGVSATILDVKF